MAKFFLLVFSLVQILFVFPVSALAADTGSSSTSQGNFIWPVAGEPVITSPFGYRVHPLSGRTILHAGVDIDADIGDPVYAIAPGTVILVDYDEEGYGNYIEIDHGNGIVSLYGHNSEILVTVGQQVMQGTPIAYAGATGGVTGAHCHLEIRLNGTPVDPVPYLTGKGVYAGIGAGTPDVALPWSVETMYKMGDAVSDFMKLFSTKSFEGYKLIKVACITLFWILALIDLCLPILLGGMVVSKKQIIEKIMKYGIFFLMLVHWWNWFVDGMLMESIVDITKTYSGSTEVAKQVAQPQLLLQKAVGLVTPALNKIASYHALTFYRNLMNILPVYFCCFVIMGVFILLTFQVMVSYIEFFLAGAFSIVTLPFGSWRLSRFLPEGGLSMVINSTLKLILTSLMVCFITFIIKDAHPYDNFAINNIPASAVAGPSSGGPNVQYAYQKLISMGLTPTAAAAVVGNLMQESYGDLDPTTENSIGAFGIAQWYQDRRTNLENYASEHGVPPTDFDIQLEFLVLELKERGEFDKINQMTSLEEATSYFCWDFEAPGEDEANLTGRIGNAQMVATGSGVVMQASITAEQISRFFLFTLSCCGLALVGILLPKRIMKVLQVKASLN